VSYKNADFSLEVNTNLLNFLFLSSSSLFLCFHHSKSFACCHYFFHFFLFSGVTFSSRLTIKGFCLCLSRTHSKHTQLIIFTFNLQARKKPHSVNSFTADSSGGKLFSLMTIVTPGKAFRWKVIKNSQVSMGRVDRWNGFPDRWGNFLGFLDPGRKLSVN
jgi:hypothetical protein